MIRGPALPIVEPVAAVLVTAMATLSLAPFYSGWTWLPVVAGAVLLGGSLTAFGLVRSWPWWAHALVAVPACTMFAQASGYLEQTAGGLPTPRSLASLGEGLVNGVPRMLTIGLPADVAGDVLVVPVVLGWLAGAVTVVVALRTAAVTALAAPPLLLYVAGLLLTASRPQPRPLLAGAVLLGVLLVLLVRSNRVGAADREGIAEADAAAVGLDLAARRRHSAVGRIAFGLPAVVGVAVLGVVAAWLLPIADGAQRVDPRAVATPPVRLSQALSPLVQLRPQQTGPRTRLFTVAVTSPDSDHRPDRVRVAALGSFDGVLWTGARDYGLTGSTLPGFAPPGGGAVTVRLDVQVDRLVQPFLPMVGEPVRFEGTDFAFDRATGTAVSTRSSVAGFGYATTGELRPQDAALRQAGPSETPADAAFTRLPGAPPWVGQLADQVTQGRETAMQQLLAIEAYLRAQSYGPEALPGHSYGALNRVLLGAPAERVGNAGQFAAAFAVLARAKGYPVRVAVGYLLRPEQRTGDRYAVFTSDAHAWPEVHLDGYGWVAFEPTDSRSPVVPEPPRPPDVTLAAADADTVAPQRADELPGGLLQVAIGFGIVLAVAAGMVAVVAVAAALTKAARRRRRMRRGPPARRVVAAWAEVVDRLREAGVRVPVSRTHGEVAGDVGNGPTAVAARTVAALAPVVTRAVYAPWEPTEHEADRAWELATRARRELAAVQGSAARLRGLVDPRPLFPRRRRAGPAARVPAGSGRR